MSTKSIYAFFQTLQREYYTAELRSKIYPIPKDKKYHKRVMSHKKKKIEDISTRNNLPSIFNDPDLSEQYRMEVYGTGGMPPITYRNDSDVDEFKKWDAINYFSTKSEVRFDFEQSVGIGKIKNNSILVREIELENFDFNSIDIEVELNTGPIHVISANKIQRIL